MQEKWNDDFNNYARITYINKSGTNKGKGINKHILGCDTLAETNMTGVSELLTNIKTGNDIYIQGHTRNCVELVNKFGSNKYFGNFIYFEESSITIISMWE